MLQLMLIDTQQERRSCGRTTAWLACLCKHQVVHDDLLSILILSHHNTQHIQQDVLCFVRQFTRPYFSKLVGHLIVLMMGGSAAAQHLRLLHWMCRQR